MRIFSFSLVSVLGHTNVHNTNIHPLQIQEIEWKTDNRTGQLENSVDAKCILPVIKEAMVIVIPSNICDSFMHQFKDGTNLKP